jgi:hypothetical protein
MVDSKTLEQDNGFDPILVAALDDKHQRLVGDVRVKRRG